MVASLFAVAIFAVRTNKFTVIDRACASRNVPQIQETYRSLPLPSYGAALKGLSSPEQPALLPPGELEQITGLPPAAFAPPKRPEQTRGLRLAPLEAAAGLAVGSLLSVSGMIADDWPSQVLSLDALKQLESYELITLSLSLLLAVTTSLAVLDRLVLNARLLEALGLLLPRRREAVMLHEAGHFLCAYYLGVPVQACELNPWRTLLNPNLRLSVGTVFHSPAVEALREGDQAEDADVDAAAVVLMGGIAAEALVRGYAEGGRSDERMLRALLNAQHLQRSSSSRRRGGGSSSSSSSMSISSSSSSDGARLRQELRAQLLGEAAGVEDYVEEEGDDGIVEDEELSPLEVRARARWAAARAVLLLRERREAFDALCQALKEGRSVGGCVEAMEAAGGEQQPSRAPVVAAAEAVL